MDALPIVPAVALSFGATYYLGKACLKLFINSLEHPTNFAPKASGSPEIQAPARPAADTIGS
jgi:hypothetical protein